MAPTLLALTLIARAVAAPIPASPSPGLIVAGKFERGASPWGQWGTLSVGAGADGRAVSARLWVPAAVVADLAGVRAGPASPSVSATIGAASGPVRPSASIELVTSLGDPDVSEAAWGLSGWGTVRAELGAKSVAWIEAGATTSPTLRPVKLALAAPSASAARTTHQEPPPPPPGALPTEPVATSIVEPRHWLAADARAMVGFDEPGAMGAAYVGGRAGPEGADLSLGIVAATAGGRRFRGLAEVAYPVVSALTSGLRVSLAVEWRPVRPARPEG